MAARLAALLPRLVVATLVLLLGTATFTYAAERRITSKPVAAPKPAAPADGPAPRAVFAVVSKPRAKSGGDVVEFTR